MDRNRGGASWMAPGDSRRRSVGWRAALALLIAILFTVFTVAVKDIKPLSVAAP